MMMQQTAVHESEGLPMFKVVLTGAALAFAVPVLAQPTEIADPYGAASISKGRIGTIERKLEAAYQKGDRSPEILLNLAAIRLQEKRPAEARDLYKAVLAQPNLDMATLSGGAMSHEIAQRGMAGALAMID
jgi:thioredoxin-like negative regulator of GroEL